MSSYAWPLVVLIIALVVIFVFQAEISDLIKHTKKVGATGLETHDPQALQQQAGALTNDNHAVEQALQIYDNPLVLESEALIRNDLATRAINTPESRETALVRGLASANIMIHFERTHNSIWASQLAMLRDINISPNGIGLEDAQRRYETAKAAWPDVYATYSFERWLAFLEQSNMVARQGDRVVISVGGREYLKYLVSMGRAGPFWA